ncbi:MAG: CBS domain-containing protein [Deltaproteobacteria bacterium]|nr:CBS domain-containing protein [Deltaproteobacteria bacterium]
MKASELMTTTVVTVTADNTVGDAVHLLAEHRVRQIPIVDAEKKVFGLITSRILMRAILPRYITKGYLKDVMFAPELEQFTDGLNAIKDKKISDFIKEDPKLVKTGYACVGPDTTAMEIAALFVNSDIPVDRIMVVDEGKKLLGLISPVDLFRKKQA